eukprot:CAMPEP_0119108090 /NCGR_PEP_ID=MMETSP1180-20130426/13463_1 /TAXON_ID=3052 ORGANISM="Chlamydomonas cf sp, Strain CCMP681" /NCGR_SAMPLE_ID=MMETSP1180 /ASSEMBLY_ACC=CAM_ASM_000741 /LENGTH=65 /DNA_ID=CAMNT_0007093673 /DNA_START=106 /DNA_END=303 /DNA_ORIENTATION=-
MGLVTRIGVRVPPWAFALFVGAIPVGTYSWMLYTRPNIYEQIVEEIKKQENAEKNRTAAAAGLSS